MGMDFENGDASTDGPRGIRRGWIVRVDGASRRMKPELDDGGGDDVAGR